MKKHEIGDIVRIISNNYHNQWLDQSLVVFDCVQSNNKDLTLYILQTIDKKDVPFAVYGYEIESVTLWYTPKR